MQDEIFRVNDRNWRVERSGALLVDLCPRLRELEQCGLSEGEDFLAIKRGPRNWWLLRKP